MKTCKICGISKNDNCFSPGRHQCKSCRNEIVKIWKNNNKGQVKNNNKQYRINNQEKISKYKNQWYLDNKEEILEDRKVYYDKNAEKIKEYAKQWRIENPDFVLDYNKNYREQNKERITNNKREYNKVKRQNSPTYKLRHDFSSFINISLKRQGSSKAGKSIFQYLKYTIQELKEYFEKQFESWMTWGNWGIYNPKTWDDNDSTTWTWQIDHIIPCSQFHYISMEDEDFQKCWSLNNLRPLSAKQNITDGNRRKRGDHVRW